MNINQIIQILQYLDNDNLYQNIYLSKYIYKSLQTVFKLRQVLTKLSPSLINVCGGLNEFTNYEQIKFIPKEMLGCTGYIDRIKLKHLNKSVGYGTDNYNRSFISLKVKVTLIKHDSDSDSEINSNYDSDSDSNSDTDSDSESELKSELISVSEFESKHVYKKSITKKKLLLRCNNKHRNKGLITIFQRYDDNSHVWAYGTCYRICHVFSCGRLKPNDWNQINELITKKSTNKNNYSIELI